MLKLSSTFYPISLQSEVIIASNAIDCFKDAIAHDGPIVLFYDRFLEKFLPNLNAKLFVPLDCAEHLKSRNTLADLQDLLVKNNITKDALFISFGGGALSDLITLLASTYLAGVKLCLIPTTLLAMVDAALGGKGAINACGVKNRIATIYPAQHIIIDPRYVLTQDYRQYISGLGEVIKYGLIQDASFFSWLEEKRELILLKDIDVVQAMVERSCMMKLKICEIDPFDRGIRRSLNFGHTIAHALEALYSLTLTHGEALAFGMVVEAHISHQKGFLDLVSVEKIYRLIKAFGFDLHRYEGISAHDLFTLCSKDKKNSHSHVRFVALSDIGKVYPSTGSYLATMTENELTEALTYCNVMQEKSHDLSFC